MSGAFYPAMSLSLPVFNPNAGRLGTLLESLPGVGQTFFYARQSMACKNSCPTEPQPMTMAEAR
jgi:hypothetical protein